MACLNLPCFHPPLFSISLEFNLNSDTLKTLIPQMTFYNDHACHCLLISITCTNQMQNARRATPFPTHHSNATTSARAVTAVTVTRQAQVVYKMIDRNAGRLLLSMMHLLKHCSHNTIPKPTNNQH